jgi:hypothetical protein
MLSSTHGQIFLRKVTQVREDQEKRELIELLLKLTPQNLV